MQRCRRVGFIGGLAGLVAGLCLTAAETPLPLHPVDLREGFEGAMPAVTLWATNGTEDVHLLGPSTEKAFEGTAALKLDVTLTAGSYHYWGAPLSAVCEGKLLLSARILLDPASSPGVSVGFGCNMVYPPTTHSGCAPFERVGKRNAGEWVLATSDLVEQGLTGKDNVLRLNTVNVTGDSAGAVVDRWGLFVYGHPGDRVIAYLDDIRLLGETPDKEAYVARLQQEFETTRHAFSQRVEAWQTRYAKIAAAVPDMATGPGTSRQHELLTETLQRARKTLTGFAGTDYAHPREVALLEKDLTVLEQAPDAIRRLEEQLGDGAAFAVFVVNNPIINTRATPDLPPLDGRFGEPLRLAACAGETESGSLGVYAAQPVTGLTVTTQALHSKTGTIAAEAVDVRALLWWYQGKGDGIAYNPQKELKAELLVKDAHLIRVDRTTEENYLRSTAPDGSETFVPCSTKDSAVLEGVRPMDAETLQPLAIPAGTVQEYWVTVHVPDTARPGLYQGALLLEDAGGASRSVPVELTVHPFELLPSRLIYSVYYRATLAPDGLPTITSEQRSEEQYRAEIADMKAHGVLYPTNYQGWGDDGLAIRRVLDLRRDADLPAGPFFNLGRSTGNSADPAKLEALKRDIARWVALTRRYGYTETYFYGIDEATGERLASQRTTWEAVQDAGGKTFVACYVKTFEAMGNRLNCAVLAGRPNAAEAAKWHGVGSLVFCYAYPQVGVEAPETYRRNFGLVLWRAGFDGAMDYAYQHGFNHVWNDFDDPTYRDHNFTYPTVNGVVGTLQWEGFREAVDDVRYVTTLEAALRSAPTTRRATAEAATAWLENLDPDTSDLAATRATMVDWITRLKATD